jgi:hypothetical protein
MAARPVRVLVLAALCATLPALTAPARADLITVQPGTSLIVDFSQFDVAFQSVTGPVQVGGLIGEDVILTGTGDPYFSNAFGSLGSNGSWSGDPYVGYNSPAGSLTFQFGSGPVQSVGAFMNYLVFPGFSTNVTIAALGPDLSTVLEFYVLQLSAPIVTSGFNNPGAFRGIGRASADIYGFRVTGGFALLDDLAMFRQPPPPVDPPPGVPEPATVLMLAAGLGVALRRVRSRS